MGKEEKLVRDPAVVAGIVRGAEVCRLGMADGLQPYVVPLSFGYDGQHIYLHCAPRGKKVEILEKNPCVCLEFEQDIELSKKGGPCSWGYRYRTVVAFGKAEPVEAPEEKAKALNLIIEHCDATRAGRSFTGEELASVRVYKVALEEATAKVSP